jgi:replicative DNA helicase
MVKLKSNNKRQEVYSMSFIEYKDSFMKELEYRNNIKFDSLCKYGIAPLDDALRAINKRELIVIAAGSGYGKSELGLAISRHNAINGKVVAHYNLEGGWMEAVQRMKWRDICTEYYNRKGLHTYCELDYRKWSLNETQHKQLVDIENSVLIKLRADLKGKLYLYDNPAGLNCKTFCESLVNLEGLRCDFGLKPEVRARLDSAANLDLIVIDHLHYFSLDKEENEISEITSILKTVKRINEEMEIPVILIAHLRKLPRGHGVPDKEDIYGTGNIHKIANTCIILAPDHERYNYASGQYPTYMRIAKSRQGIPPNVLINSVFDIKERKYSESYDLYKAFPDGSQETSPMTEDVKPLWARRKIVPAAN